MATEETIAVFSKWQSDGYEEGVATESNSAHTQAIEDTDLPEPDTLIQPADLYIPDVGFADDYRCFILPYEFDKTTFVYQKYDFPDRLDLVHHVIVYVGTKMNRLITKIKMHKAKHLAFPASAARVLKTHKCSAVGPQGSLRRAAIKYAHQISKGSVLIMQMHYNLAGKTTDDVIDGDQTQLTLWTLEEEQKPPDYLLSLMPVFDRGINIPPLENNWVEESLRRLPLDAKL